MAAREIGKIMGKIDIDDILDVIFSRFCIWENNFLMQFNIS